jgi:hypothetical protein
MEEAFVSLVRRQGMADRDAESLLTAMKGKNRAA